MFDYWGMEATRSLPLRTLLFALNNYDIFFTFIVDCHTCSNSTYTSTCFNCNTVNCTIQCDCEYNSSNYTTEIYLLPGLGNGCDLWNIDGNLTCVGFCP